LPDDRLWLSRGKFVNWFDVILALLFAVGIVGGYFQGLIRQALSLGAVACGIILATYLHLPVAAWLAFMFPATALAITETAAFLLSLLALVTVLEIAQRRAVPATRLLAIGVLDRIAGALVAVVCVTLQLSIGVLILKLLVTPDWPIGGTLRMLLTRGMLSSTLASALYGLLVTLVTVIGALLPQGRPRFVTFL
jgi:membrane protein required for colicin V production